MNRVQYAGEDLDRYESDFIDDEAVEADDGMENVDGDQEVLDDDEEQENDGEEGELCLWVCAGRP